MKDILIWSDFACPFCYIGEKRLKDALEALDLDKEFNISYKAYQLNRDAPRKTDKTIPELIAKKYNLSLDDAKRRVEEIDKAGNEAGLVFRYATAQSSNTLDAHRLMKLAEDRYGEKVTETLNDLIFQAYFSDNRNIADHDVLLQLAENAGIPSEEASRVLNSKHYTEQVRQEENEAISHGVKGVPFIVFDRRIAVPGALSVEDFKKVLIEVTKDKKEGEIGEASSCDAKGCR